MFHFEMEKIFVKFETDIEPFGCKYCSKKSPDIFPFGFLSRVFFLTLLFSHQIFHTSLLRNSFFMISIIDIMRNCVNNRNHYLPRSTKYSVQNLAR